MVTEVNYENIMEYEDMEGNKVVAEGPVPRRRKTKTVPKSSFIDTAKARIIATNTSFVNDIKNIKSKLVKPREKTKKLSKVEREFARMQREDARAQRNRAILGIGQLLVVVSITYSSAVIFIGVDSLESRVALLPQSAFAVFMLFKAFSKLYK